MSLQIKARKVPYGPSQEAFIQKTRQTVEAMGVRFFDRKDWTRITPSGGQNTCLNGSDLSMYAETFYVKPLAVWIPHLLVPFFLPSCPNCERRDGISLAPKLKWIDRPKILYGIRSHRYLDTIYYASKRRNFSTSQ